MNTLIKKIYISLLYFATQDAMSPEFIEIWECLSTRLSLPTLLNAKYSEKLKKYFFRATYLLRKKGNPYKIFILILCCPSVCLSRAFILRNAWRYRV